MNGPRGRVLGSSVGKDILQLRPRRPLGCEFNLGTYVAAGRKERPFDIGRRLPLSGARCRVTDSDGGRAALASSATSECRPPSPPHPSTAALLRPPRPAPSPGVSHCVRPPPVPSAPSSICPSVRPSVRHSVRLSVCSYVRRCQIRHGNRNTTQSLQSTHVAPEPL